MIARAAALVAVAVVLRAASPALAQPSQADLEKAKAHYEQGETHYNLGEFDKAVAEYKKAYALTKSPAFLFNIAQAYRLEKDYAQALYFYRTYLRVAPEAQNRADVERRIAEMKEALAELERQSVPPPDLGAKPPPDTGPKPPPDTGPKPPPDTGGKPANVAEKDAMPPVIEPMTDPSADDDVARPGRGMRIAGISTGAAGLALFGTAIAFTAKANSDWDDIDEVIDSGGQWSDALHEKWNDAEDAERNAAILYAAGGAAIVAGGVLWFLGHRRGKDAAQISAAPTSGGVDVLVTWGF